MKGPKVRGTIHVIPQSHIDVAWLWRYDPETIHRCCRPTFTLATENMERFPDYTFSQSQVPLYEAMELVYPELFSKIKRYVQKGRWEIVGGMYVEAEGGEPCGESLVRQCVMGKRYFREKFGVDVRTGWQEDAWSHPWQLPQILKKSGIESYMFKRGEKGERLFWWEAPDGSRVLAYKPLHGNPSQAWMDFFTEMTERYGVKHVMVMIGKGDHGGGPTPEDVEAVKEFAREHPEVEVRFSTFAGFVETLLASPGNYPVLRDELGLELRGDLTNCGEIKKSNRRCENLLMTTEKFSSFADISSGLPYPKEELYEAWKKLLFNQFHDIIGGSGIPPACEDAIRFYRIIEESCRKVLQESLSAISEDIDIRGEGIPIIVSNPLSWRRTGPVEVELEEVPDEVTVVDWKGKSVPAQIVRSDGAAKVLFVAEDVPSLGYKTYYVTSGSPVKAYLSASEKVLENEFLRVEIDPGTGYLRSIYDKLNSREVLAGEGNILVTIEDEGDSEGRFRKGDDILARPKGRAWKLTSEPKVELSEDGPVRARVRIRRRYRNSSFLQDLVLYSGARQVDFVLTVDWHDVHRMIKVAFPVNLKDPEVTYDTAYGTIVRPADGSEYPAQKWVDLSSGGYGVSLLNDSRYAHDVEGSTIRMSVLRSPTEPAYNTDEGVHTIGYALYPHGGIWKEAEVMRRGYEFNYPLIPVVGSRHAGRLPEETSFMEVGPSNIAVEVMKKAFDTDEFVVRLYEFHGEGCTAEVSFPWKLKSACEADLMEDGIGKVELEGDTLRFPVGAYEIKTVKVRI